MKRNKIYLNVLACFGIAMGLSACGGGSFSTLEVNPEPPKLPEPTKVEKVSEPRQNPEQQEALKQPAAGFAMRNIRRNTAKYDSNGESLLDSNGEPTEAEMRVALDPDKMVVLNHTDLSNPLLEELNALPRNNNSASHTDARSQSNEYQYIRFGYAAAKSAGEEDASVRDKNGTLRWNLVRTGWDLYTFYHGVNPSSALPTQDNVKYKGQWHFMSDVVYNKGKKKLTKEEAARPDFQHSNGFTRGQDGNKASAVSETYSSSTVELNSEFNVNFAEKNLTGDLKFKSKDDPESTVYKLKGGIKDNRFTGSATSQITDQSANKLHKPFFYADSANMEGGFYGPNAEEMAGKFLANDNSMFVVFGAKRDKNSVPEESLNVRQDAYYLTKPKREEEEYEPEYPEDETDAEAESGNSDSADNTENTANSETATSAFRRATAFRAATEDEIDTADSDNADAENPTKPEKPDADNDTEAEEPEPEPLIREHLSNIEKKHLPNFGYAMKLRFGKHNFDISPAEYISVSQNKDGTVQEWVSVCCSKLEYLRFGEFNLAEAAGKEPVNALYLQGERTPVSSMIQSGKAKYTGTWSGFISVAEANKNVYGNPDYKHSANWGKNGAASKATFDVDFDQKSLTGSLVDASSIKVFGINATIKGNGFTGTASTEGEFRFDAGNQNTGYSAVISNATVNGAFYGPGAQELGGTLIYNSTERSRNSKDVRAGAVFGASKDK